MRKKIPLFYVCAIFGLALSATLLAWLQQSTALDLRIADYYFNASTQTFPWKKAWFSNIFMHQYVKNLIILGGIFLLITVLIDGFYRIHAIKDWLRFRLRFVSTASIFIPLSITTLKQTSTLHCPWDIDRYGGNFPYFKLLDAIPSMIEAGHCFPAGHASTGLWLAACCVFWLPQSPRKDFFVFLLGLSIGFLMGWVQQMRGAHFLSHTLWSVWIASAEILGMLMFNHAQLFVKKQG